MIYREGPPTPTTQHPGRMTLTDRQRVDLMPLIGPTLPGYVLDFDAYDAVLPGLGDRVYFMVVKELIHAAHIRAIRVAKTL